MSERTKMLITPAMMTPQSPMMQKEPRDVRSFFVTKPYTLMPAKVPVVTKKT